ncbi:hypothetical protein KFE25_006708 [Diacronema lutheri]|uniref:Uncharacterized protein n=2 Tax=Diacronema lutheri TaxID=2081491 RepID=A0A8J5XRE4_DIALT|nr:hypothetical protein KFE25_006708 [Diacronema lutheri]
MASIAVLRMGILVGMTHTRSCAPAVRGWACVRSPTRGRAVAIYASSAEPTGADDEPAPRSKDWRAVRARLVAQEAKQQQAAAEADGTLPAPTVRASAAPDGGWMHETPLIEQGSVILASTAKAGTFGVGSFTLSQQYFAKSVILITSHSHDFTRGLILNRRTPFTDDNGWNFWFGGDVQSLADARDAREMTCLHTLSSPAAERMSIRVLEGIFYTSLDCARALVAQGLASKSDFWAFVGYAGWGPGQLQDELDRPTGSSWRLVSADSGVLLRELIGQRRAADAAGAADADADGAVDADDCGIGTWARLNRGIGLGSKEVDSSAGGFSDRMLREWVRVNLRPLAPTSALTAWTVAAVASTPGGALSAVSVRVGTVLRSAPCVAEFTLSAQFMHKALVLVLRSGRSGSVGVILNRISGAHVMFPASGRKRHVLFGGKLALRDSAILWLHRRRELPGEPIGDSGVFRTTGEAVALAISRGRAVPSDFVCVHGLQAWGAGMLEREIAAGSFVPIAQPERAVPWERIWEVADPAGDGGPRATVGAGSVGCDLWEAARAAEPSEVVGGLAREAADGNVELADLALLKWADTFLA